MWGTTRGSGGGRRAQGFTLRGRGGAGDSRASAEATTSDLRPLAQVSDTALPKLSRPKRAPRPRPTHFIAIPLNTNQTVLNRFSLFQNALLEYCHPRQGSQNRVRGLDPSIVIDPRRFHITLGVMALEDPAPPQTEENSTSTSNVPSLPSFTVESALALLRSLEPKITDIISKAPGDRTTVSAPRKTHSSTAPVPPLHIVLDKVNIMDAVAPPKPPARGKSVATETRNDGSTEDKAGDEEEIWSKVFYVAPSLDGVEGEKLRLISDLVHQTFKHAGYLTDTRPLKLHCTILNTSHRRPSRFRGDPFSYSDILKTGTINLLSPRSAPMTSTSSSTQKRTTAPPLVPIDLGDKVDVEEIGLWIMGSRGLNNEYISCGGVKLR